MHTFTSKRTNTNKHKQMKTHTHTHTQLQRTGSRDSMSPLPPAGSSSVTRTAAAHEAVSAVATLAEAVLTSG